MSRIIQLVVSASFALVVIAVAVAVAGPAVLNAGPKGL